MYLAFHRSNYILISTYFPTILVSISLICMSVVLSDDSLMTTRQPYISAVMYKIIPQFVI